MEIFKDTILEIERVLLIHLLNYHSKSLLIILIKVLIMYLKRWRRKIKKSNTFRFIILIFSMIIVNSVKGIFIKEKDEREIIGFLF